jgi:hypothetical protein
VIIRAQRIRSLARHVRGIPTDALVVVGLGHSERFSERLKQIGFSDLLQPGERVLPASLGPRTRFNAEGDYLVHKDQPMETAYRQMEWRWTEFRGRYDTQEMSKIVDVPYKRYPRTFRPPPSIELTVAVRGDGSKFIITDAVRNSPADSDALLHRINVFLELFEEAQTLTEDLDGYIVSEVRRLNWSLLPAGEYPWPRLRSHLDTHVERAPEGNRPVLLHRLETVNSFCPTFTAIGQAGFAGYIVFGFPSKKLFVLESLYYGNATYVFGERWEELSKRTKAEIISGHHEEARIIHLEGWDAAIGRLLR